MRSWESRRGTLIAGASRRDRATAAMASGCPRATARRRMTSGTDMRLVLAPERHRIRTASSTGQRAAVRRHLSPVARIVRRPSRRSRSLRPSLPRLPTAPSANVSPWRVHSSRFHRACLPRPWSPTGAHPPCLPCVSSRSRTPIPADHPWPDAWQRSVTRVPRRTFRSRFLLASWWEW